MGLGYATRLCLAFAFCASALAGDAVARKALFIDFDDHYGDIGQATSFPPVNVSSDGSTVYGQWYDQVEQEDFAFRWRPGSMPERLFTAPFAFDTAGIVGVSDDGESFVTHWIAHLPNSSTEPVRWSEATGPVGLGSLSAGHFLTPWTLASSYSGDGKAVIGATNDPPGLSGPFIWTDEDGLQPRNDGWGSLNYDASIAIGTDNDRAALFLGDQIQYIGPPGSRGISITSDGAYGIVADDNAPVNRTLLWSQDEGLVEIDPAPGQTYFNPGTLSDNGSVAFGTCDSGWCLWRRDQGVVSFESYLDELGLTDEFMGLQDVRPIRLSSDGSTFVGMSRRQSDGAFTSWAVVLVPEPATSLSALLVSVFCGAFPIRRG